ncbi:hypothetical protein HPB52_010875 [Rhipicephalus sanguineus]|uniref:Uncharacterized protein n=1 Tax=Rhipicephalus sanguineus TaxID=34632 RepID=A0A9D4SY62_RHISA|nr:hypothetical protein HPB52_010875 [Rhipicephalus sanguineus]
MRGFMTQSGLPDNPRASRYILKDFVNGKLLYSVAPPGVDQKEYHTFPPPAIRTRRPLLTFDRPPQLRRSQRLAHFHVQYYLVNSNSLSSTSGE